MPVESSKVNTFPTLVKICLVWASLPEKNSHDTHSLPLFPQELSIAVAIVSKVQKPDRTAMYTHFCFYICYFIVFAPAKSAVIINHLFGNKDWITQPFGRADSLVSLWYISILNKGIIRKNRMVSIGQKMFLTN
jgi:hypothetical protein